MEVVEPMPRVVGSVGQAKHLSSKRCSSVVSCVNDPRRTPVGSGIGSGVVVSFLNLGD